MYPVLFHIHTVAPKIRHEINQQMAEEGQETEVFCVIEKGNPLPTFKWQYQPLDCTDGTTNCLPDESRWVAVPTGLMVTPTAIPTNKSLVKVKSDEANTFYRCQASNSLGNDSQVVRLVRLGKKVYNVFLFFFFFIRETQKQPSI